jgi:hypothetical protein
LKPCFEFEERSSLCMDLHQVSMLSEVGNGRFDQLPVVDCFDLEKLSPLAIGSSKKMRGNSVKRYFLGLFHSKMGRVLTRLLEGFLLGFEGIPLRKWIRAALKSLEGLKGIEIGPSLNPNSARRLNSRWAGFKGFGFGFSLKPKTTGRLKPSRKVHVLLSMVSFLVGLSEASMEWVSSLIPKLAMVVPSYVLSVSVVWQGALVLTNGELGFGVSLGATDVGSGSSLVV